jgi:DNA-binding NtrC family response regulator
MFCGYCGNENAEDYNFCVGCGKPLESNSYNQAKQPEDESKSQCALVNEVKNEAFQSSSFNQLGRNPAHPLQQSLKQSFHVEIPDQGVNLKNLVEQFEKELLIEALEKTGWIKNKAAILLNLNRTTLVEKLKKLNITNPR